jgi:outer membrane protein assembly factor BamB
MSQKAVSIFFLLFLLATSGCFFGDFPFKREIREAKHISNFTTDNNYIYFGAGYKLYRLDVFSQSIEVVYATDRIRVEQPIIADGAAYFGGLSYVDEKGNFGEKQGFFAVDLLSRKNLWKFPLGVGGYGTFGTYPVLTGDRILVCARQHLHCLDRKSGKELWKLDNWMGKDSDGITVPYVHQDFVYFKIEEEYFTGSDALDGHWAKVNLQNGHREAVLPIAETPGKYEDQDGHGIGVLANGVIYGATRYNQNNYPFSRFGALDLEAQKLAWEVKGSSIRTQPALTINFVFTVRGNSIQALDRKTGKVVWSEPLGEIAHTDIDRSQDRWKWDYENEWSRRFAATEEIVVAQGSQGIVARRTDNGKFLWLVKTESESGDADPLIFQQIVIVSSVKNCSVFALELKTGKELWRVKVPDCRYFYIFDD